MDSSRQACTENASGVEGLTTVALEGHTLSECISERDVPFSEIVAEATVKNPDLASSALQSFPRQYDGIPRFPSEVNLSTLMTAVHSLALDSTETPFPFTERPYSFCLDMDPTIPIDHLQTAISPRVAMCREAIRHFTWGALERDSDHLLARLNTTFHAVQGTLSMLSELLLELKLRGRHLAHAHVEWAHQRPSVGDAQTMDLLERRSYLSSRIQESREAFETTWNACMPLIDKFLSVINDVDVFPLRISMERDKAYSHFEFICGELGIGKMPGELDAERVD